MADRQRGAPSGLDRIAARRAAVLTLVLLAAAVAADPPPFNPATGPVSAGLSAVIAGSDQMQVTHVLAYLPCMDSVTVPVTLTKSLRRPVRAVLLVGRHAFGTVRVLMQRFIGDAVRSLPAQQPLACSYRTAPTSANCFQRRIRLKALFTAAPPATCDKHTIARAVRVLRPTMQQ